jgi:outer membrane protein assembly factor BamB
MRSIVVRYILSTCAVLLLAAPPAIACVGDCNGDAKVAINELVVSVRISLGAVAIEACDAIDNNRDRAVAINELIRGVTKSLNGCGLGSPGQVLLSGETLGLTEYDLGTGASVPIDPFALIGGQACLLSRESGEFAVPELASLAFSWAVYSPDGTYLRSLLIDTAFAGDATGCAVDSAGRFFGTIASPFGQPQRLVIYFPPDYGESCIIDETIRGGGAIAIDDADNVHTVDDDESRIVRLSPPFPSSPAECGQLVPTKTTFIDYDSSVTAQSIARGPSGRWVVSYSGPELDQPGSIREYDAEGTFVRELFPPGSGGFPAGLAFDAGGTLYYVDRAGTIRRINFDPGGNPSEPELVASGLESPEALAVFPSRADEWLTLGGSYRRTYFNPRERVLNRDTAANLIPKWKYFTSGMISAQPVVTWVDLPGEGRTQIVIASSWDHYVYALRAENGSLVWRYLRKPQPGTFYPFAGTPTIAWIDGQQRVYVPGGETMYCLDATTGEEIWQFDAGTGCTNCTPRQERNQIESTPAVVDGKVMFGMDINDNVPGKGGVLAVRADDGRLVWFLDMMTLTTCRPFAEDNIRRFDAFHTEAELGLPEGFFASRPGCDFDRYQYACGNVWSSPAVDLRRGLLYTASSNCDTDDDPETAPLPPPMKPYDEAIFALTLNGDPAWVWRPREVDNDDLSFGAVPNLFEAEIGGAVREVVGIGGKDGTYYLLDRDGENELTGVIEPYWRTQVVPGGPIGGIIGSASVGEGEIVFQSGFGTRIDMPQRPSVHALDPRDGSILWQDSLVDTGYCSVTGVPGLAIAGGIPSPRINFFDRDSGEQLHSLFAAPVPSGVTSASTVVGGQLFVGAGTGAFNEGPDADREANRDTPLSAFCVEGTPGCATNTCDDGNVCTYDYRNRQGACVSEPGAEGLDCRVDNAPGTCMEGNCVASGE